MKEIAGLVGDMAQNYGRELKPKFENETLYILVNELKNGNGDEAFGIAEFVVNEVSKL